MPQHDTLKGFFYDKLKSSSEDKWASPSAADLKKAFSELSAEEKHRLLLTPLSATVFENALTYITFRGFISHSSGNEWRTDFLKASLDEIEGMTQDKKELFALLTSTNELGQTVFHVSLKAYDDTDTQAIFDVLTKKLCEWGGKDAANEWMKSFLNQHFGEIDSEIPSALQQVVNIGPSVLKDVTDIKAAEYKALKSAVEKICPLITEYFDKNPIDPEDTSYTIEKKEKLKEFAGDRESVKEGKTPLSQVFPEKMFLNLLELQQKVDPKTPEQLEDYLFDVLSKQDAGGNTLMHRLWQYPAPSGMRGNPTSEIIDVLAPVLAGFDRVLGESAAISLTTKLLLQENNRGELPLDKFLDKQDAGQGDTNAPDRNDYIQAFLLNLRAELGSQEKFTNYVTEIIASVLPPNFTIRLATYASVKLNSVTGKPTRPHGAQIQP